MPYSNYTQLEKQTMRRTTLAKKLKYGIPEIRLMLVREPRKTEMVTITTPEDAAIYLEPLKLYPEEQFVSLHMDARHQLIGYHLVSHGTLSSSLVHPREVFKAALLANSHTILLAHNHPTGRTSPSDEDLQTTEQLVKAGALLGVSILDHIIVGDSFYSIRENYPSLFKG